MAEERVVTLKQTMRGANGVVYYAGDDISRIPKEAGLQLDPKTGYGLSREQTAATAQVVGSPTATAFGDGNTRNLAASTHDEATRPPTSTAATATVPATGTGATAPTPAAGPAAPPPAGPTGGTPLPTGYPGRAALARAGYDTIEKVRDASDAELDQIEGIGETTLRQIREYTAV